MKDKERELLENDIRNILHRMSDDLPDDKELLSKIQFAVECGKEKEDTMNKRCVFRRIAIAASLALLVMAGGVYAGGNITQWISRSDNTKSHKGIMPKEQMRRELGKIPKYVEIFSNGFMIEESMVGEVSALDESNVVVGSARELYLSYRRGEGVLSLNILADPDAIGAQGRGEEAYDESMSYKDIELGYSRFAFKFVPPDYQASEEEEKLAEEGRLNLAYGSSEIRTGFDSFLSWEEEGICYQLLTEEDISKEELFDMAKEIIDAE